MESVNIGILAITTVVVHGFYRDAKKLGADRSPQEWSKAYDAWATPAWRYPPKTIGRKIAIRRLHRSRLDLFWVLALISMIFSLFFGLIVYVLLEAQAYFVIVFLLLPYGLMLAALRQSYEPVAQIPINQQPLSI